MFTVTYGQRGMDATIYWGSLDYKFVNSTDHPMRIDASVSGGYVHIKLVGTAPKDKGYDHIVLRHEVVATVQPKMEIDGDKTIITDAGTAIDENGNTVNIVVDKDGNIMTDNQGGPKMGTKFKIEKQNGKWQITDFYEQNFYETMSDKIYYLLPNWDLTKQ